MPVIVASKSSKFTEPPEDTKTTRQSRQTGKNVKIRKFGNPGKHLQAEHIKCWVSLALICCDKQCDNHINNRCTLSYATRHRSEYIEYKCNLHALRAAQMLDNAQMHARQGVRMTDNKNKGSNNIVHALRHSEKERKNYQRAGPASCGNSFSDSSGTWGRYHSTTSVVSSGRPHVIG